MKAKYPSWEPEYRKAWFKSYQEVNREKLRAKSQANYIKDKERIRARGKTYYQRNKEVIKAKVRAYAAANQDLVLRKKAAYRAKMKKHLAAEQLKRYYRNRERDLAKHAEYRARNRHRARDYCRKRSLLVTDGYAREMLSKYSRVSAKDWPQELVDAKRAEIMVARLTGDGRYKELPDKISVNQNERTK